MKLFVLCPNFLSKFYKPQMGKFLAQAFENNKSQEIYRALSKIKIKVVIKVID